MPNRWALLVCPLALLSGAVRAQTTAADAQTDLIRQMARKIDELERRVAELEAARAAPAPGVPVQPPAPAPLTAVQTPPAVHDHGHMEPIDAVTTPSMKISGFSDINFSASDLPGAHSGFNEGQFILHISSALSSRVSYFGEISMT